MICPYCNYEHGMNYDAYIPTEGVCGEFYRLAVKLERLNEFYMDYKHLYACPACSVVFINNEPT